MDKTSNFEKFINELEFDLSLFCMHNGDFDMTFNRLKEECFKHLSDWSFHVEAIKLHAKENKLKEYNYFLITPYWKIVSKENKRRSGYQCQACNKTNVKLNTHHSTYDRIYHEIFFMDDLVCLCEKCHSIYHKY